MSEIIPLIVGKEPLREVREIFAILSRGHGVFLLRKKIPFSLPRINGRGFIFLLTSGSGGTPKVVVHSLAGLLKSSRSTLDFYGITREDRWPLTLPLYHVAGLQVVLRCLLARIPLSLELSEATVLSLVPTQLAGMMEDGAQVSLMKRMKAILVGGAPLSEELRERARGMGLPLSPTYGMTETGSQLAAIPPRDFLAGQKGMRILPGKRVSVVDSNLAVGGTV